MLDPVRTLGKDTFAIYANKGSVMHPYANLLLLCTLIVATFFGSVLLCQPSGAAAAARTTSSFKPHFIRQGGGQDGRSLKPAEGQAGHLASTLLDDGSMLAVHNNYLTMGMTLIRWRP